MTDLLLQRLAAFFDENETAGQFLSEDGDGGYVAAVARMAREIRRLRINAGILLANLDCLQEAVGETLEAEDAAIVEQIRKTLGSVCDANPGGARK